MIKADVLTNNKSWKKFNRTPNFYINKKLEIINKKNNLFKKKKCYFTLLLSGDMEVKKLNIKFKKKKTTTKKIIFSF